MVGWICGRQWWWCRNAPDPLLEVHLKYEWSDGLWMFLGCYTVLNEDIGKGEGEDIQKVVGAKPTLMPLKNKHLANGTSHTIAPKAKNPTPQLIKLSPLNPRQLETNKRSTVCSSHRIRCDLATLCTQPEGGRGKGNNHKIGLEIPAPSSKIR